MAGGENQHIMPFFVTLGVAVLVGLYLWFTFEAPRYEDPNALERTSFTKAQRAIVNKYLAAIVFDDNEARLKRVKAGSDGRYGTRAAVSTIDGYGVAWQLTIDPVDTFKGEELRDEWGFVDVLVHELGHIVLLNNDQINYYGPKTPLGSCGAAERTMARGCFNTSAYLYQFTQRFWSIEEVRQVERDEKMGSQYDSAKKRYRFRANQFVTPYAATSPVEDSAESFAAFILSQEPQGRNLLDEKVRFFYRFEELIVLRERIRSNLATVGVAL